MVVADSRAVVADLKRAPDALLWAVPLLALLAGVLLLATPLGLRLSQPLVDMQHRWLAPQRSAEGVVVFDIDDPSLAELKPLLGPWPFKRDAYALVIEQLREAGATAVAIDLLLADAHEGDAALARAIARPGAPVVLGAAGLRHVMDSAGLPASPKPSPARVMPAAQAWPAIALPATSLWPKPEQSPALGIITTPLDDDGRLRRLPLWHSAREQRWPVLPLAVWQALHGSAQPDLPIDADGMVSVAFPAHAAMPRTLPFSALARAALGAGDTMELARAVKGQVVFIGSSALLADSIMTVSGQTSGTAVLAQSYAAMRDGQLLRPSAAWAQALLMAVAIVPALATWRRGRSSVRRDGLFALLGLVLVLSIGTALLLALRMPTPWAAPLAMLIAGFVGALWHRQRWLARTQAQLERERAIAMAASQAKSEFLANVSHEMRTPMNALLGVAELLAESELTPAQRRQVQMFRESGQALLALIGDLLDMAKIEAGHMQLDEAAFSLPQCLRRLQSLLEPRAQAKGLALAFDIAIDVPHAVLGDHQRLEQVLINLLGNAIKFTSQGGVRLQVSRVGAPATDMLSFEVSDTGIGIAPSQLQSIFEPFVQADGNITRHFGGTGLGLSITRSVTHLMGGQVQVHSTVGQGSRFSVVLPLPEAALPPPPPPAAGLAMPLASALRVLLAEDNEVNSYVFCAMLEREGVHIDVAANGITALAMVQQQRYDIAFLDLQMPGMDGLTLAKELRRLEHTTGRPRLPLVALTANAFASDALRSREAGFDVHMSKPASKADLLQALATWVPARSVAPDAAEVRAAAPPPPVDRDAALARLGGDEATYQRVLAHAAVFMLHWHDDFSTAEREGQHERMRRLAHDLKSVAASVGAFALSDKGADLEQSLQHTNANSPSSHHAALAAVLVVLAPVVAGLTL